MRNGASVHTPNAIRFRRSQAGHGSARPIAENGTLQAQDGQPARAIPASKASKSLDAPCSLRGASLPVPPAGHSHGDGAA